MKFSGYFALLILLLDSCIEPFNLSVKGQETIAVDGMITDQPGPQTVKIFKTLDLEDQLSVIEYVQGAAVSIIDELGAEEALTEMTPGNYQSDSLFQGVVGKTYTLRFTTNDGELYESMPETLLPVGDIDSLYHEFELNEPPVTIEHGYSQNGFNIYVDATVLPEQEGLVRWRWTGTFEIKTYPELRRKPGPGPGITYLPDPPRCSGYDTKLQYQGPCSCCHCWVTQYNDAVTLSDEQFISNNKVTRQKVAFVQANRRYLYAKYYLEVEQMSVSQRVFEFWQKVGAQQTSSSSLFQTPPPPTSGNIQVISGTTPVVGIFAASAIRKQTMVITSIDVPYVVMPIDTIAANCKDVYRNSTTKKPVFW